MEETKRKLLIIIPAYNEAENLEAVVKELREKAPDHDILLVDDGSSDGTADLGRSLGLCVAHHRVNLGLSAAIRTGMKYALDRGYDHAIQFDADGQHDASAVDLLYDHAVEGDYDIVIGSRYADSRPPVGLKTAGLKLISFCIRLTTLGAGKKAGSDEMKASETGAGSKEAADFRGSRRPGRSSGRIKDPTSGMRIYDRSVMKRFASSALYGPEPDTLAYLIRQGFRVSEVGVKMYERQSGRSYLDLTESIRYMFRMCTSILLVQWFR